MLKSHFNEVDSALQLYQKEAWAQMFSCEHCEISKNIYFEKHLHTAAPEMTLGGDCLGLSFWRAAFKTILV